MNNANSPDNRESKLERDKKEATKQLIVPVLAQHLDKFSVIEEAGESKEEE